MSARPARKLAPKPVSKPKKKAQPGPDGYTLGGRLKLSLEAKGHTLGREFTARELLDEANRLIGRGPDNPVQTQQALSKIMRDLTEESAAAIAYAAVLGVLPLWLQYGVGPRSFLETLQKARK